VTGNTEFLSIAVTEVLLLHDVIIARYGGAAGLLDRGLLEGALGRAETRLTYGNAEAGSLEAFVDAAVAVAAGIVSSHPFVDGNKRTGLQLLRSLLHINGVEFTPPVGEEADAMVNLADGKWDEAAFQRWVLENSTMKCQVIDMPTPP
jgi:death-on-curing protein